MNNSNEDLLGEFMKRKQYKFYYKLVTFFLVLSTIPVIIVGFFSYQRSAETIEQNVTNEKLQTVGQTQLNIEHILKTVDHSFTNYVRSYPLIQTLSRTITPERFQLYNQINKELNELQTFDTDLSDITLISQEKKVVYQQFRFISFRSGKTSHHDLALQRLKKPLQLGA